MNNSHPLAFSPVRVSATLVIPANSIFKIEAISYETPKIAEDKPLSRIYFYAIGSISTAESFYSLETIAKAWQEALR